MSYALLLPRNTVVRAIFLRSSATDDLFLARFCRRGFVLRAFVESPIKSIDDVLWA